MLARENGFEILNHSQEQPLPKKQMKDNLIPSHKVNKRRILSSTGPKRNKLGKPRNRIQTAKYINNVNKAVHNRWRVNSQLNNHDKKAKIGSAQGKYSDNKKKKKGIPLADYAWPADTTTHNNGRPTTAGHMGEPNPVRPNFEAQRRNIQSRGRANPTGLSGTSQSSQAQDGRCILNTRYRL